jgi:hypothetical protein
VVPGIILGTAVTLGLLGALSPSVGGVEPPPAEKPTSVDSTPPLPTLAGDIRVRAFLQGYSSLIDSVRYLEDDVVFSLPRGPVYFQDGKMLGPKALEDAGEYDPVFYPYSLAPLSSPTQGSGEPVYSRDFLGQAFGTTED